MNVVVFFVVVIAVVVGLAFVLDLRAKRRRGLAADFGEAGRLNARNRAHQHQSSEARTRPTNLGDGPTGGFGPSAGP
jgi:hypothetical protein